MVMLNTTTYRCFRWQVILVVKQRVIPVKIVAVVVAVVVVVVVVVTFHASKRQAL